MRKLKTLLDKTDKNTLYYWDKITNPYKIFKNAVIMEIAKFLPPKNKIKLYRSIGMKIGSDVSIAYRAMFDILYPELIEIGDNSIIGYGTVIVAHDFTVEKARTGKVKIGRGVLIGANCTVLAGIEIGDGAVVSSMSLVNRNVRPGEFVGGVPIKRLIKIK